MRDGTPFDLHYGMCAPLSRLSLKFITNDANYDMTKSECAWSNTPWMLMGEHSCSPYLS